MNSNDLIFDDNSALKNETLIEEKGRSQLILTQENWRSVAKQRIVNLDDSDVEELPVIELEFNQESFRFATLRNFSVVLGKPKSRKSTFLVLLISEVLKSVK